MAGRPPVSPPTAGARLGGGAGGYLGGEKASEASVRSMASTAAASASTIGGSLGSAASACSAGALSVGSAGWSQGSAEEDPQLAPTAVDIQRLLKVKAEQERRLLMLGSRIEKLQANELKVWKDVTESQQKSLQAQEKHWRRQVTQSEQLRWQREEHARTQGLKDKVRDKRVQEMESKDLPRQNVFDSKQDVGRHVRQDSKRLTCALHEIQNENEKNKKKMVEIRRWEQKKHSLKMALEQTRSEQAQKEKNANHYAKLQEEIQCSALAISAAERDEVSAVHRLQNSHQIYTEVLVQLQDIDPPEDVAASAARPARAAPSPIPENGRPRALSPRPGAELSQRPGLGAGMQKGVSPMRPTAQTSPRSSRLATATKKPSVPSVTPNGRAGEVRCRSPRVLGGTSPRVMGGTSPSHLSPRW